MNEKISKKKQAYLKSREAHPSNDPNPEGISMDLHGNLSYPPKTKVKKKRGLR